MIDGNRRKPTPLKDTVTDFSLGDGTMGSTENADARGAQDATIDVVLAADANYAMPMSVAICSTAINCANDRLLRFNIIESGFSAALKQRVCDSLIRVRPNNSQLDWYPVLTKAIADLAIAHKYWSSLIYARLLLPWLLPSTVKRALYLDSDVGVEGDVSDLWDTYKTEKALGAVRDRVDLVSKQGRLINFEQLRIDPETPYFNTVLLFNVVEWREQSISYRI